MTCEQVRRDSLAERYLLSELAETEAEEFEKHFFACRPCFEELKTLRALEQELRAQPAAPVVSRRLSWMAGWRWAWAAALVAVIAAFVWTTSTRRQPAPVAQVPAPRQAASVASEALMELARIEPPHYEESLLRGVEPRAGGFFRQAMTHYRKGDYAQAIAGLQKAASVAPKDPGSRFFLSICLLLTGQGEAGADSLQDTIALGDSPYLEEARFYLAKALLGQGKVEPARRELLAVIAMRGDLEVQARNLLHSLPGAP